MAIYHLTHRKVGRSTHAAGTAGAHVTYITRASACRAVIAEHMPEAAPGSRGGATRTWLDAQEQASRKNARVIDKLEIALPLELDQAQRVELVRAFVRELAGGKAVPFFAAIHDKAGTKDAANPHAHVVIRDCDPVAGKGRVIGMSEKGSTERAREVWEQVCNEALRDMGHSARIDRRSLADQGITDRKPQEHQGVRARHMEQRGMPSARLSEIRQAQTVPGHLQRATERAAERERAAKLHMDSHSVHSRPGSLQERLILQMRGAAQKIGGVQSPLEARKGLRQNINRIIGTRVWPDKVREHFEDIATLVFRKRKQLMKLRNLSAPHVSKPMAQPWPPAPRSVSGPGPSV